MVGSPRHHRHGADRHGGKLRHGRADVAGQSIRGIIQGDSVPELFIPRLIELHRQGRFPFDRLIKFYPLDQINQAAADSASGATIKPIPRTS